MSVPKVQNRLAKVSSQGLFLVSFLSVSEPAVGRLDTLCLIASRAQDIGRESVDAID